MAITFLDLYRRAYEQTNLQGVPATVSVGGLAGKLANAMKQAWLDLQASESYLKNMQSSVKFNTVVGQWSYTLAEVFNGTESRFGEYDPTKIYIAGNTRPIQAYDYELFTLTYERTNPQKPTFVCTETEGNLLLINRPDAVYTLQVFYTVASQTLTQNGDIIKITDRFSSALMWMSLIYFGQTTGDTNLLDKAANAGYTAVGGFERKYNVAKTMTPRPFI